MNRLSQIAQVANGKLVYSLPKTLQFLESKGKELFGNHFLIRREDKTAILKILILLIHDQEKCKTYNLNPNKGILLTGPVGSGKTSIMRLAPLILPRQKRYIVTSTRNISFNFFTNGYQTIEKYGRYGPICFDDLGVEQNLKHYGNQCNVMGEILLSRYDLFISKKIVTHATTNLRASELEELYGNRIRSRMRSMFNLITFDKNTEDKRL